MLQMILLLELLIIAEDLNLFGKQAENIERANYITEIYREDKEWL
jgi:hypothetical protein